MDAAIILFALVWTLCKLFHIPARRRRTAAAPPGRTAKTERQEEQDRQRRRKQALQKRLAEHNRREAAEDLKILYAQLDAAAETYYNGSEKAAEKAARRILTLRRQIRQTENAIEKYNYIIDG